MKLASCFTAKLRILFSLVLFTTACSSVKHLKDDDLLIEEVTFVENGKAVKNKLLNSIVTTRPNRKFLGVPWGLLLYNQANPKADSLFDQWLLRKKHRQRRLKRLLSPKQVRALKTAVVNINRRIQKSGEPPSLVDSVEIEKSINRIAKLYKNLGYFDVLVEANTIRLKDKKAQINYTIETKKKYTIDSVTTNISSPAIDTLYSQVKEQSFLKRGSAFEIEKFELEQKQLVDHFRNNGIYNFQQNSIKFTAAIDSTGQDLKIPVIVNIGDFQKRVNDTLRVFPYEPHKVRKINLYVNDNHASKGSASYTDSVSVQGIDVFSKGKLKYNSKTLTSGVFIKKDSVYTESDQTLTYRYFSSLKNFKYPSIVYALIKGEDNALQANVFLTPKERYSLGVDLDLSHSNIQDFGIGLGGSLGIRNVFRGAELFELSLKSMLGSSQYITTSQNRFFNLFEISADVKLFVPKIVLPFSHRGIIPNKMYPKTEVIVGTSFQKNIGLDKQFFNGSYQFNWIPVKGKKINFRLIELEFVNNRNVSNYFSIYRNSYNQLNDILKKIENNTKWTDKSGNLSIPLKAKLFMDDVLNDKTELTVSDDSYKVVNSIKERYDRLTSNNLILGSSLGFSTNNREDLFDESFYQFRSNISWMGYLLDQIVVNGIVPSQYVKAELDLIKHWQVGYRRIIAVRAFTGLAIPYGIAKNIPFSRSFYSGGANDNRAWEVYGLGPGSSNNINEFSEANFKIAFNLEYRAPLIGKLNGAVFVDMGNIWNLWDDVKDLDMRFEGFKDLREIAIGSGIGLRYDFNFFVFRFDIGFKTYNPSLPKDERWWSEYSFSKAVLNLGINYPF